MGITAKRIKKALEMRQMKQTEIVEKTTISKSLLSQYISGSFEPKQRNLNQLAKVLNVSPAWLMGYTDTIEPYADFNMIADLVEQLKADPDAQELLRVYFENLSADNRKRLLDLANALGE